MPEQKILQMFHTPSSHPAKDTSSEGEKMSSSPSPGQVRDEAFDCREYERDGCPFISSVDRVRWKVIFLSGINCKVNRKNSLYTKVLQYIRLVTQVELSGKDNADFYQLCREAEQNLELESWIEVVDDCMTRLEQQANSILPPFLSLEEFLSELRKTEPDQMTLSTFTNLVQRVDIRDDLLNSHIPNAGSKPFLKENIHNSRLVSISLVLWKPGGCIPAHEHQNSLSVIRICKGTLSHWQNLQLNQTQTVNERKKIDYIENELVTIDYGENHELSNQQSNKDLLTLHFRFYRPSDDRDREGLQISK
jgi:predicted metal-dependent enzyme (double-stranded beta helix superfamily)